MIITEVITRTCIYLYLIPYCVPVPTDNTYVHMYYQEWIIYGCMHSIVGHLGCYVHIVWNSRLEQWFRRLLWRSVSGGDFYGLPQREWQRLQHNFGEFQWHRVTAYLLLSSDSNSDASSVEDYTSSDDVCSDHSTDSNESEAAPPIHPSVEESLYLGSDVSVFLSHLLLYQFYLKHIFTNEGCTELLQLLKIHMPSTMSKKSSEKCVCPEAILHWLVSRYCVQRPPLLFLLS